MVGHLDLAMPTALKTTEFRSQSQSPRSLTFAWGLAFSVLTQREGTQQQLRRWPLVFPSYRLSLKKLMETPRSRS